MRYREQFDGLEGEPAPISAACPACGAALRFDLWAFSARARPGHTLRDDEVAALGLYRADIRGIRTTRVHADGPSAYVGAIRCGCGSEFPVVVGLGEFQPGRWVGGIVEPEPA